MQNESNYWESLPSKRHTSVEQMKEIIKNVYPTIEQKESGNMLYFYLKGINLFVIGNQKHNLSFYFSKALMLKFKEQLKGLNLGKGTIRFVEFAKINSNIFTLIIKEAEKFPFQFSKRGDSSK